jgi:TPP-dependent trihydroxycyclohexane-1,2-dione (THcHDO) dehydratase
LKATSTLFPIRAIPPLAPPQSIPLAAHALFSSRTLLAVLPSASKAAWADSANELQAIAVSEYAVQAMSLIQSNGDVLASQEQTEDGLKGYEEMADWIACAVERAMKAWKYNIGDLCVSSWQRVIRALR